MIGFRIVKRKPLPGWAKIVIPIGAIMATLVLAAIPINGFAAVGGIHLQDFTAHWGGIFCVIIFVMAYSLVIAEETLHLRKSKPVMVAAGIIWLIVAIVYAGAGDTHTAEAAVRHNLLEFAELFLFLLAVSIQLVKVC